jgi:cell wall-associated NlpC family hydrolase
MPSMRDRGVWVGVHPDAAMFGIEARKAIKVQTAGMKVDVPVTADTKPAIASVEALRVRMRALNDKLATLRITADGKQAEATVVGLQAKLAALAKTMTSLTMSADTKKLDAQIVAKIAELKKLQQAMTSLKMDADDKALVAKLSGLERQAFNLKKSLDKGSIKGDMNVKAARDKLESLNASITLLKHNAADNTLVMNNVAALRNIALVKAEIASLQKQARNVRLGGGTPDTAAILAAEAGLVRLEAALGKASDESNVAKAAMGAFFAATGRGSTFAAAGWKLLTGHLVLFGGALNRILPKMFTSVAVWHLLADAVIELVAVWAPAIIAVTAFGVAGADAAKSIYNRMVAVHTVMDATGKAVPPLKGGFDKLAASVKPEVYQLFGDALVIMNKRGGAFNKVAVETGRVLDQLAARFVLAVTSGTGVNKFMENAVNDVRLLGDSIGNLGGIFGAVFRAVPGYAEILLQVGDAITKVLEAAAQAAEPVIALGLKLHGFFIYTGVAATAALGLVGALVKLTGAIFKFNASMALVGATALKNFGIAIAGAIANAITYTGVILGIASAEGIAAGATALLADAMLILSRVPIMVWVTLAAAAVAGLVFVFRNAHSATQDFTDGLNKMVQAATITQVIPAILGAQAQVTGRLAAAQDKLAHTTEFSNSVNFKTGQVTRTLTAAYRAQQDVIATLTREHDSLGAQFQLVSGRVGGLAKQYGGTTAALGLLNAAGITTAQITDKNNDHWKIALIQVAATAQAYTAMGTQAGVLGNDLDVLGRTVTDQAQAVKKLNDAWGQFIGDVTGTQGAFDTVAQGFFTLQDHAGKLTFSLGKLKIKYDDQKAAIDSLTPAGIALNQAFGDQVVNIDKLFASWRTAGLASNLFTSGVKASIAPLVKYASGSKEATAQLIALAEEAGYQGPISLQALTKWLGNTHGATQRLKDITNTATEQEALLTGAMRAQGNFIANTLINDINNAALAYNGVEGAAKAYGRAIAQFGRGSAQANAAQKTLIDSITRTGIASGSTAGQIAALSAKVLGIKPSDALRQVYAAILAISGVSPQATKEFGAFATAVGNGDIKSKAAKASALALADQLLGLTGSSKTAHAEFITLAGKIGLTREKAEALWKQISGSLTPTIAHQANVTLPNARNKFEDWAKNGLGLGTTKADVLYKKLETQLGPGLNNLSNKNIINSKAKFIDWAMNSLGLSHDKAEALRKKLVALQAQINAMHGKNVGVNFVGSGTGSIAFKESIPGVTLGPSSGGILGFHAAGGRVPGFAPGVDSHPAMLSGGEFVLAPETASAIGYDNLEQINKRHTARRVGFAAGGLAGSTGSAKFTGLGGPSGVLSSGQHRMGLVEKQFGEAVEKHYFALVLAKFRKDMNALAGGGPGIVRYARSWLGKIPYVFGGTSWSGDDCSGFTQAVYGKFGIHAPRTSEAQYAWATRSHPVPGSLAFYISKGGGADPGHVAIVQDAGSVISQGGPQGVKGPKIQSLHFLPLMGTGVPKGGFPRNAGGAGNAAIGGPASAGPAAAKSYAASQLGRFGWGQAQMKFLDQLWTRESNWNRLARNPSSGAYGIPQALPASKMGAAANPPTSSAAAQINWGEGYVKGRYGSPQAAWSHELSYGWYGKGGAIPGMATGGTVAGLRATLAAEQRSERAKYFGLVHSFAIGPAKYRTKTVTGELATLAARQSAEQGAYAALSGKGLTTTRMHHFGATARSEARVAADKGLSAMPGGHPLYARDLQKYLGKISVTASGSVPARSTSGGGSTGGGGSAPVGSFARQGQTWLNAWRSRRAGGWGAAWGPIVLNEQIPRMAAAAGRATTLSHAPGLSAGQHKFWANAAADERKRLTVLKKELTTERGWRSQLGARDVALSKDVAAARGIPALAGNTTSWKKEIAAHEYTIKQISKMLGYSNAHIAAHPPAPVLPKVTHTYGGDVGVFDSIAPVLAAAMAPFAKGGMAGFTRGGMAPSFDRGGVLSPGYNTVWNGLGRNEHLVPAGQNVTVTLEIAPGGNTAFEQLLHTAIRKHVRIRGGGSVQRAYSTPGNVSGASTWRSG